MTGQPNQSPDRFNQIYRFKVTFGSEVVYDAAEIEGLTVQREVVEVMEGGENSHHHKLVGPTRYSNIVLRYGSSDSTELFDWIQKAIDGEVERKDGSIMALNRAQEVVKQWDFRRAWPCRYQGPEFRAGQSEVAIELLELAHEGFEGKKGG